MTDAPSGPYSIKFSPETVAAIREHHDRRMAMTAEQRAAEIREERQRRRRAEIDSLWRGFCWWRKGRR